MSDPGAPPPAAGSSEPSAAGEVSPAAETASVPPPGQVEPGARASGPPPTAQQLRPVTIPVLVSAIANLIGGYVWFGSCVGIFLTAPMLVLCAFEIMYFVQAPRMERRDLTRRTTALGIFEILLGVFNAGISIVCGILVLINLRRLEDRLDQPVPAFTVPPSPPERSPQSSTFQSSTSQSSTPQASPPQASPPNDLDSGEG